MYIYQQMDVPQVTPVIGFIPATLQSYEYPPVIGRYTAVVAPISIHSQHLFTARWP